MLDFVVSSDIFGKPVNADLNLGLATAPVLYAALEYPELWEMIDRSFKGKGDVQRSLELVRKSQGIEKTKLMAVEYARKAQESLESLKIDSPAINALYQLCNDVTERQK